MSGESEDFERRLGIDARAGHRRDGFDHIYGGRLK